MDINNFSIPNWTLQNHKRPYRVVKDHIRPWRTIQWNTNHARSHTTIQDNTGLYISLQNQTRLFKTFTFLQEWTRPWYETIQNRSEQNSQLGLTASLLAGAVSTFPQKLPGPGQPAENRTLTVPYLQRYIPITGWRAIPAFVFSRHHAYMVPPLVVRKISGYYKILSWSHT